MNFDSTKLSSILKNPAYVKADVAYNYYKSRGAIMANEVDEFDVCMDVFLSENVMLTSENIKM